VTGLLSLREQNDLRLVTTSAVKELLTKQFPLLPALQDFCTIRHSRFPYQTTALRISSIDLSGNAPRYAHRKSRPGDVVGLRIEARDKTILAYLPCLPGITDAANALVAGCDCVLVDGTFWSDNEMISLDPDKGTAGDMDHVPIGGPDGSLAWLRGLNVRRKIYTHINNTNPILRTGSRHRNVVEQTGVEIAFDGMDIRL